MAKLLKLRRGTTTQHGSFTGAEGEVTVDTDKETLVVHDGSTAGGHPVAAEDMANVSSASIAGRLSNDSIATSKLAAGALPTDVTVSNANIVNGTITNAEINGSAAIAGTKISPNFGSQNISTTGDATISGGDLTVTGTNPIIHLTDTNDNSDFQINVNGGVFNIYDYSNSSGRLLIASDGTVDITGNLDANGGLDVTGNITVTGTVDGRDVAADGSKLDGIESGATADQSASEILTSIKTVDGSGSGLDADTVDGIQGANFVRSDTGDTLYGTYTISNNGNQKLLLSGSSNPYIRWQEGTTNKAYIQWVTDGELIIVNEETGEQLRIGSGANGLRYKNGSSFYTVWHAGNDGTGTGLDADLLDGMHASDTASNSTVVARNSNGYIFSNYINTTDNSVSSSVSGIICKAGDDYHRTANASAVRSFLNVENGATADQSASEIATALRGQTIGTSSNGTSDIYNDNWFRNNASGEGLYNQATTQHFYSDNDDYWNIAGGTSANGLRFRDDHNGTIRGYAYANNSSQIGFLNGSGNWSLKCDNSGNVTATGNVTAYSDARLKTNVNTINDALSICGKLRGVSFDWKESGKHSIGVIAQEVEEVLPEVVLTQKITDGRTDDNPNPETKEIKSVDYGKIVGVLINAINELKAEVEELKGGK